MPNNSITKKNNIDPATIERTFNKHHECRKSYLPNKGLAWSEFLPGDECHELNVFGAGKRILEIWPGDSRLIDSLQHLNAPIKKYVGIDRHDQQAMRPNRNLPLLASYLLAASALMLFVQPALAGGGDVSTIKMGQTTLALGIGWEHLKVGTVEFGGKYNYTLFPNPPPLVSTNEQQDGNLDGVRTDAMFSAPAQLFGLPNGLVNLKGFYAWFNKPTTLNCTSDSESANCDGVPLFDPNVTDNNTVGSNNNGATYVTSRKVQHWGLALEAAPANARIATIQQQLGIGYKAIDQDMNLISTWPGFGNNQNYDETLNTGYLGAYWGASGRHTLHTGIDLSYGGEVGVYWAHTAYNGALNQTDFAGTYSQNLDLNRNETAFIGALDVALKKQFRRLALSGYVRGEYYSYAPQMAYNQTNYGDSLIADTGIPNIYGPNVGTHIENTNAWSVTIGVGMSVPL